MLNERMMQIVQNMVGPKKKIPDSFNQMYERVQRKYSTVAGNTPLGLDVVALMLELSGVDGYEEAEYVPVEEVQTDKKPKRGRPRKNPDEEEEFRKNTRVSAFVGDHIVQGILEKTEGNMCFIRLQNGELVKVTNDNIRIEE